MDKKTNYGKIIAITIAVISAASAIAYVIYRLARNFFAFCDTYYEDELDDADFDIDDVLDEEEDLLFPEEEADEAADEASEE